MLRIGLTGGIGSGKSTVQAMLASRGAATVDADAISRAVTAPGGAAIATIARRFGADFIAPDGSLDRARMREHVYQDPSARHALEAIIHPLVGDETQRRTLDAQSQGRRCIVLDIPLLVESGRWRSQVERVLVVDCNVATQIARVGRRSGLTPEAVQTIINAQAPREQRLAAADIVVFNEVLTLEQLAAEVALLAQTFGL